MQSDGDVIWSLLIPKPCLFTSMPGNGYRNLSWLLQKWLWSLPAPNNRLLGIFCSVSRVPFYHSPDKKSCCRLWPPLSISLRFQSFRIFATKVPYLIFSWVHYSCQVHSFTYHFIIISANSYGYNTQVTPHLFSFIPTHGSISR